MQTIIQSEFIHTNLHDLAYIAKLSKPTDKFKYDREFLPRKNIKRTNYDFYFQWYILEPGVYEKKESHHYMNDQVSYFAINNAGEKINISGGKQLQKLIFSDIDKWAGLSKLKVQLFIL